MNRLAKALTGVLTGTIMLTSVGAGYLYTQRDAVMEKAAAVISNYAAEAVGTKIEIGNIEINKINVSDISDITISNLAVYDKHSDLIAKADSTEINLRLLAAVADPLTAINEIKVHGVEGHVVKRSDGTWNFSDLQSSGEGESNFDTNILIDDIKVDAAFDGNELTADVPNLNLDFDSTADFSAEISGAHINGNVEGYDLDTGDINGALDFDHNDIKADIDVEGVSTNINDTELVIDKISAALSFDEYSNVGADVKAAALGADVHVTANVAGDKQIVNVKVDTVDIAEVVPFIPAGTIPDGVELLGGIVSDAKVNVLRRGDNLSFSGSADITDGSVMVEQTRIDDIDGSASFTDAEVLLNASAQANGQRAQVTGSIKIDTDEPYFDLNASSDSFDPTAVMYLPAEGSASFTAHLTGTPSNPIVEADIQSPYIVYEDISAVDVSTHFKYQDNAVYLSDLRAGTFGGTVSGDLEVMAPDLSYNAHLKVDNIDLSRFGEYAPAVAEVEGRLFGDIGINGVGGDVDSLKVYGTVAASNITYSSARAESANASFNVEGGDITIDYLSVVLPTGGSLGAEGTITDGNKLDLNFYAARVDLTMAETFLPQVEISGLADFEGSVHGNADNPNIDLKFSAVDIAQFDQTRGRISEADMDHLKGRLLDQPYDSIKFAASGCLDGIEVSDFTLTKGGKDVWLAKGNVGLTGEKKINLQIDTVGARAETIAQLVAPDSPLTGNVDNIITVTGTLDNPHVVGYIHFWRGSYRGVLVNGMDGDYFVEGNQVKLQDFHIYSPMVDMILNGIIDSTTTEMNFIVEVNDINVERFRSKLPEGYPASGHGKFSGIIGGTLDMPIFNGELTADTLSFNDVEINNVSGHVSLNGDDIFLDNFSFEEGEGSYTVHGKVNYINNSMSGRSEVRNADIANLLALANFKNDVITGRLNSNMQFGGTMQNPGLQLIGTIPEGGIAGCDIHDINLNVNLLNRTVYINTFEGRQGGTGTMSAQGSAQLNGMIDIKFNAANLALEMFSKAAGLNAEVRGVVSVAGIIGGTTDNPSAQADITASGGIDGSTFDLFHGSLSLNAGVIDVEEMRVQKAVLDKIYQVSVQGQIPLIALAKNASKLQLPNSELNLDIVLDNADLNILPLLTKNSISWGLGEMAGKLKVTGVVGNPLINGNIMIKEGTVKVRNMSSLIEHVNMNLAFSGDKMTVEDFSGNIGKGKYNLSGDLKIDGLEPVDYNFNFKADNLEIISKVFSGPVNGEISVNRQEVKDSTGKIWAVRPKIVGYVNLDKCIITVPSLPDSDGEMPTVLLDVAINLGDKVHCYSPYLFDLYLTGSAKFEGTTQVFGRKKTDSKEGDNDEDEGHMDLLNASGVITVKRGGTVNYLKTNFDVREGELQFHQGSFMPIINFSADTKISKTRVVLNIDGQVNESVMKLSSEPELSETEIMQLLTLRDAYQKGGDNEIEGGDLLMIGLQMSFLSEIESAVRKVVGFDRFSISRGSGSIFDNKTEIRDRHEDEYNVTIGKYITDKTMLRYTGGIGGDSVNRYGIEYDINDGISATVEREGRAGIVGIEAHWKVDW